MEHRSLESSIAATDGGMGVADLANMSVNGGGAPGTRRRGLTETALDPLQRSMAITRGNKVLVFLALVYTTLTTIELGVITPFFLFLIGQDHLATQMLFAVLMAAIGSQCFKRFVWRPRPWMAGRAIQVKKDLTSSFPSRAVLCAVVYGYILAHWLYSPGAAPIWVLAPIIVVCALGASLARIFVGAHYLSDCIAGFIAGIVFCGLGALCNRAVAAGCSSCVEAGACYAATPSQQLDSFSLFSDLNLVSLFVVAGIGVFMVAMAMSTPVLFWVKCIPIFGLLAPTLAFRLVLLCPQHNDKGVALFRMADPSAGMVLLAALVTGGALGFAKLVNLLTRRTGDTAQLHTQSELANADHHAIHGDDTHDSVEGERAMDPAHRLLLQCTSIRGMLANLALFLAVYAVIFITISAWRIAYAEPAQVQHPM